MSEGIVSYLSKKKKERVFDVVIGILMALLAIIFFTFCILYFEWLGKGLFYLLSLLFLLLFGFVSIFFLLRARFAFYMCSFFEAKKKKSREESLTIISVSPFTTDRHFASWKVMTDDGPIYWAAPLGEVPLVSQKKYSFLLWDNWIVGWREEE